MGLNCALITFYFVVQARYWIKVIADCAFLLYVRQYDTDLKTLVANDWVF